MYFFSFIYGILAALIALVLQILIDAILPFDILSPLALKTAAAGSATIGILFVAFIEEAVKAIAVSKGIASPPRPLRAYLHALFVGIGFVVIEYALIALMPYDTNPFAQGIFSGNLIIHAGTPLVVVTLFIMLRDSQWLVRTLLTLAIVTLLHASYNILSYVGYAPTSLPQLLFLGTFVIGTLAAIATLTYPTLRNHS